MVTRVPDAGMIRAPTPTAQFLGVVDGLSGTPAQWQTPFQIIQLVDAQGLSWFFSEEKP